MQINYKGLGRRVRQQRDLKGMTQDQLAERVGVSCSFIGHIERGEKKASLDTLVALSNALVIPPTVLLQDSLTNDVLESQMLVNENEKDLFRDLMGVFREHSRTYEEPY